MSRLCVFLRQGRVSPGCNLDWYQWKHFIACERPARNSRTSNVTSTHLPAMNSMISTYTVKKVSSVSFLFVVM